MPKDLLPLFKWTGGKRREISTIKEWYPDFVTNGKPYTYVEPFAGAAAVYWSLNNLNGQNILNDFEYELANFYRNVQSQDPEFLKLVAKASSLYEGEDKNSDEKHKLQEANYYAWRNKDRNGGLDNLTSSERAARFWIVNQLAFSGMRRFNSSGEFNVPYGHYKNLNSNALTSKEHVNLLKKTSILSGDYKTVVESNDKPNTFIFIDPPYTL